MTRYFFITGHQRSRTAWLANLFTTDHSLCWHDPSRMMRNPPRLEEIVNDRGLPAGVEAVGASDNGLPIFPSALDWYREQQPDLPIAIIKRPLEDVLKSLLKMHYGRVSEEALVRSLEVSEEGLARIKRENPGFREYDFHDLNDLDVLSDLSKYLLGRELGMARVAALRMFNVQLQEPHYSAGFSAAFQAYVRNLIGV